MSEETCQAHLRLRKSRIGNGKPWGHVSNQVWGCGERKEMWDVYRDTDCFAKQHSFFWTLSQESLNPLYTYIHILVFVPYLFAKYLPGSQNPQAGIRILLRPCFLVYIRIRDGLYSFKIPSVFQNRQILWKSLLIPCHFQCIYFTKHFIM